MCIAMMTVDPSHVINTVSRPRQTKHSKILLLHRVLKKLLANSHPYDLVSSSVGIGKIYDYREGTEKYSHLSTCLL